MDNHRRFDVEACILPNADAVEGEAPWTSAGLQLNRVQQSASFLSRGQRRRAKFPSPSCSTSLPDRTRYKLRNRFATSSTAITNR